MNPLVLLLPLVIGLTWARLFRPGFNRLQGAPVLIVPLPLLARIRMHAVPALLALVLGFWLATLDDVPWWTALAPLASNSILIAMPIAYTLTDVGVRLGRTSFRRWTEFAGVRRAPGGARLAGVQKSLGMHIWLSGSRGDDEFLQFLRQCVKNAYKGQSGTVSFPIARAAFRPDNSDSFQNGRLAYSTDGSASKKPSSGPTSGP